MLMVDCLKHYIVSVVIPLVLAETLSIAAYILSLCVDAR